MPELAEVFLDYGQRYLEKYGGTMLPSHRRALADILRCRTEDMGGHVFRCDHCGREHYAYHSCRNRSCPKCHHEQTQTWLEKRREELLPVPHFHLVFTVPQELHGYLRRHQTEGYGALMKAAAGALTKLAADPHYVGGQVGVLSVLHTWGRTLSYHPHVHCLVPAGGFDNRRQEWRSIRANYLVPVKALSLVFRGMLRELLGSKAQKWGIPHSVWRRPWVVHCQPAIAGPDKILQYLARYVYRVAISNSRILAIDDGRVTFRYQDTRDHQWKTMTLRAEEFIRRFLQHVLPRGFHKLRYYGLWAPGHRLLLRRLQLLLAGDEGRRPSAPQEPKTPPDAEPPGPTYPRAGHRCPHCGQGILLFIGRLPRRGRGPP